MRVALKTLYADDGIPRFYQVLTTPPSLLPSLPPSQGTTMRVALKTLYADGGIPRFYQGLLPALIQGPASRFGDTAANAGVITLMDSFDETKVRREGGREGGRGVRYFFLRV